MKYSNIVRDKTYTVPIVYACDDLFAKYMLVSMRSLIDNASPLHRYHIHVLYTDLSDENKEAIVRLKKRGIHFSFYNVSEWVANIKSTLAVRDYYTKTTYYRMFIAEIFKKYDKVIYIDADTVVLGDISKMYTIDIGKNYVGAVTCQTVSQTEIFRKYSEEVLGVQPDNCFNAGILLINCKAFRKVQMLRRFEEFLTLYTFTVAQDQDYLNVLCKDHVFYLPCSWNVQPHGNIHCKEEDINIIHFTLNNKPWHYDNVRFAEYFWKYAEQTPFYDELREELENYSEQDKKKDSTEASQLQDLAAFEVDKDDNYAKLYGTDEDKKLYRRMVLNRIKNYEKAGTFDIDAEDDPPGVELLPEKIDYFRTSRRASLKRNYAFRLANWFVNEMKRKNQFIIKEIRGVENFKKIKGGAVMTCNHFHPFDSFAMQYAFNASGKKPTDLFRIIKEGNYTSFPGFYGFLMRNANTLPLSSNPKTMRKFLTAVNALLYFGNYILIYPEQSLWWNYRKPKPLKKGGFTIAAQNHVPVLPCFITMEDTEYTDADGYPVQAYTIHICDPIFPDKSKTKGENVKEMMAKNSEIWKEVYETTYGIPLTYTCNEDTQENEFGE